MWLRVGNEGIKLDVVVSTSSTGRRTGMEAVPMPTQWIEIEYGRRREQLRVCENQRSGTHILGTMSSFEMHIHQEDAFLSGLVLGEVLGRFHLEDCLGVAARGVAPGLSFRRRHDSNLSGRSRSRVLCWNCAILREPSHVFSNFSMILL